MAEQSKTTRWSKTAVTDAGTSLLTEFAAGRLLTITSAFGSVSDPGENLVELTELPDGREHPLTIESVTRNDDSVTVCIQVTSIGNPEPYKLEQIGIFAAAGGADGPGSIVAGEKLLMVIEDTEDERGGKGVTVPAETDQLYTFKLYAVLTVTNKERLEISVSAAGIATLGAIEDAMKAHEEDPNAHPNLAGKSVGDHNEDPEAHPSLTARMRATERALNGSETILAPEGDPTTETVGKKGQHYINMDTGTEWECAGVNDGEYIWGLVDYDSENYKSMRDILSEAATTAAQAKEVADGAAAAIAAVQNTISVIPSQSGSLTYNGGVKLPSWNNLALEMMTITYGEDRVSAAEFQGETDAGTYKAYVTPKEGYTWGDKSAEEKEIPWTIQRATITTAPSVSGSLSYTGEPQVPTWLNHNPEQLTKVETAQTDAGDYSSSFTPTKNYQWPGGDASARVIPWSIAKAANTFSIAPSTAQELDVGDTVVIQVTSNSDAVITAESSNTGYASVSVDADEKTVTIRGTGEGAATVSIHSKGSANYADASATLNVAVSRKTPTFSLSPSGNQSLNIGGSKRIAVTTDSDGAVSASSSAPGVATAAASGKNVTISGASAGNAVITISVPQTTKYNAASATLNVAVSRKTPTLSVSPSGNQTLSIGASKQITVTTDSDGAVSVSSSAPGVATAAASGKNVTVSGASAGTAVVTISVQQTAKYNAASATLTFTVSKPTTANSTWDDVGAISAAGTAASYFAPGDTKPITLNGTIGTLTLNNLAIDVFILGINHNASKEGSNRIHWAIGKISGVQVALCETNYNSGQTDGRKGFNMNHWGNYNYGGWKGCDLRYDILGSTNKAPSGYGKAAASGRTGYDPSGYDIVNSPVANTLMAALPVALRKVMKTVTKYTDNVAGSTGDTQSNITSSVDYLFLPAEFEVYGGTRTYANNYERNYLAQYDYFKAGNSKQLYKHDARTTAVWAPLRSPRYSAHVHFSAVGSGSGGSVSYYGARHCGGLFAGFTT